MNRLMINVIIIIIIGVLIGSSGQILIKKGLSQTGEIRIPAIKNVIPTILKLITNKLIILGLSCSAAAAFFCLIALSQTKLSISYPIAGGLFYIFITIFSWLFLNETISFAQIAGIFIIILGITILSI